MAGICPKCGRHEDDHLCITTSEGLATKEELAALADEVRRLKLTVKDHDDSFRHLNRGVNHAIVESEPAVIHCRCGKMLHSIRDFQAHQQEGT